MDELQEEHHFIKPLYAKHQDNYITKISKSVFQNVVLDTRDWF